MNYPRVYLQHSTPTDCVQLVQTGKALKAYTRDESGSIAGTGGAIRHRSQEALKTYHQALDDIEGEIVSKPYSPIPPLTSSCKVNYQLTCSSFEQKLPFGVTSPSCGLCELLRHHPRRRRNRNTHAPKSSSTSQPR